ncbi:MAG: hypothetical protein E7224_06505 [Clostridiales bacterium]|nr:hypothetical protein [Clostridiales bacterium]
MKAARYYGIRDVRFEEIPKPTWGEDEVLIKVAYAGICGSDLHIYNKEMFIQNIPETLGHEFSGTVLETGKNVTRVKPGDKVTANPMVTCGECIACRTGYAGSCESLGFIGEVRQGTYAEYLVLPEKDLVKAPDNTDLKLLAMAEPLAVALNICEKAEMKPESKVLITGPGPIGLLTLMAAKALYGVENITVLGRSQTRLDKAAELGAKTCTELSPDACFDITVEAAGNKTALGAAVSHVRPGGKVYIVSIFEDEFIFDINEIVAKQITITGCNVYQTRHIEEAAQIIADRKIKVEKILSHVFPIEQCKEALTALCSKDKTTVKVLLSMEES